MELSALCGLLDPVNLPVPGDRAGKKHYTERLSGLLTDAVADELRRLGLDRVERPRGADKQFMGGYASKGVDAYLSDERHGLLISSGSKGMLFNVSKNLKNRYRDMVMEALELHKRFPYAVCGHLIFVSQNEVAAPNRRFGTGLGELVALMGNVAGRSRPEDPPELQEAIGILTLEPGDPGSIDLRPAGVPESMSAATYCGRVVEAFNRRNPFYGG